MSTGFLFLVVLIAIILLLVMVFKAEIKCIFSIANSKYFCGIGKWFTS